MKLLDVVVWPMVLLGLSPFLLVALAIAAVVVGGVAGKPGPAEKTVR